MGFFALAGALAEAFFALAGALALLALGALVPLATAGVVFAAWASVLIQQGAAISERAIAAKMSFFMFCIRFFWLCHIYNNMAVRLWHERRLDAIVNLSLRSRAFAGIYLLTIVACAAFAMLSGKC